MNLFNGSDSTKIFEALLLKHEQDSIDRHIGQGADKNLSLCIFCLVQEMADKPND